MPGVISTNPARCRDCYRCVRTCPVKAVRVSGGQAEVVAELCIACASCVRACPQRAKVVRDDLPAARAALAAGRTVVASVAPSAPAYFEMESFAPMEQALAALGFTATGETALGAEMTGAAHGELVEGGQVRWPVIASPCPVVVNLVEQYYPDLLPHLAPVVSPMVAHARYLHSIYGADAFVVFVGPCIAKKDEIRRGEEERRSRGAEEPPRGGQVAVDAVLTFDELARWLDEAGVRWPGAGRDTETRRPGDTETRRHGETSGPPLLITPERSERGRSSTPYHPGAKRTGPLLRSPARLFPVEGGLLGTAQLETDHLSSHVLTGSGVDTCMNVLEGIRSGLLEAALVELMACPGGCVNGPAFMESASVPVSRQRVMAYAARRGALPVPPREEWPALDRAYHDRSLPATDFSEEQIREALHAVDKYTPADELNCGSCGYPSCREKAIATLRGMAEATMCIPYMRARAESLNNVVMDATPNAIVIVDRELRIQDLSPSAAQLFNCSRVGTRGRFLRELLPVEDFAAVWKTGESLLNETRRLPGAPDRGRGELIVELTVVPVQGESLLVGILRDVTERERQREEIDRIRGEAVQRSHDVINKQMRVAHEIASLLGETTAETKVLLSQLTRLMDEAGKR